jgi:flagellar protein FlbB
MTEELAQAEGEDSIVAYWLSLMPAERSARLTRLMAKRTIE